MDRSPVKAQITVEEFQRLHIAAGQVIHVELLRREKRSAYRVRIDFGPTIGERWSVVQATREYSELEMQDRLVVALLNLPSRRVFGVESEVLILGVPAPDGTVSLLEPGRGARLGADVY